MNEAALIHWEERFTAYLGAHAHTDDRSHDLGHFRRVWRTAQALLVGEQVAVSPLVLLAAAYFHDIVSLPKNDPGAAQSSWLSAEKTIPIFAAHFPDFPAELMEEIRHAIHAHSYSAKVEPQTMAAKILQDADRMEALGAIGIARTFYTGGRLGTELFSSEDPKGKHRPLDDKRYSLDHFTVKLLKLPALMNTRSGREMAERRAAFLITFMEQMYEELLAG